MAATSFNNLILNRYNIYQTTHLGHIVSILHKMLINVCWAQFILLSYGKNGILNKGNLVKTLQKSMHKQQGCLDVVYSM